MEAMFANVQETPIVTVSVTGKKHNMLEPTINGVEQDLFNVILNIPILSSLLATDKLANRRPLELG